MGSIGRRLERLESSGDSCVVCGWEPRTTCQVEWDHDFEADEDKEPEYCLACGRPDALVIRWPEDLIPER